MRNYIPEFCITSVFIVLITGFLHLSLESNKQSQVMYEKCIEAQMQWVRGNCVR